MELLVALWLNVTVKGFVLTVPSKSWSVELPLNVMDAVALVCWGLAEARDRLSPVMTSVLYSLNRDVFIYCSLLLNEVNGLLSEGTQQEDLPEETVRFRELWPTVPGGSFPIIGNHAYDNGS